MSTSMDFVSTPSYKRGPIEHFVYHKLGSAGQTRLVASRHVFHVVGFLSIAFAIALTVARSSTYSKTLMKFAATADKSIDDASQKASTVVSPTATSTAIANPTPTASSNSSPSTSPSTSNNQTQPMTQTYTSKFVDFAQTTQGKNVMIFLWVIGVICLVMNFEISREFVVKMVTK